MMLTEKFLDINKQEHRFQSNLRQIGYPITLLHRHSHCPSNYVLVYKDNFSISEYEPITELSKFFPCSWCLFEGQVKAYEFCDQEIPYKEEEIKDRLKNLENLGYEHYGTTVKFVGNVYEFETENGHVYIPEKEIKQSLQGSILSETVINGKKVDGCFYWRVCVGGARGHVSTGQHR